MNLPAVPTILGTLALLLAAGCSDLTPPARAPAPVHTPTPVPVYQLMSCREIADEFTLKDYDIRRITNIQIITENRDELLCRGKVDIELAPDQNVVIYARRLGSGRITYGIEPE